MQHLGIEKYLDSMSYRIVQFMIFVVRFYLMIAYFKCLDLLLVLGVSEFILLLP